MQLIDENEIYNYLNESLIIDSFKKQIANIKNKFDKTKNKSELADLKSDAAVLRDEIKSSSLSSKAKSALLAAIIGIFSIANTSHALEISDLAKEYNLKSSTINYEGSGNITEPDGADIVEDAKYIAVALKKKKIKGIEIEDILEDGSSSNDQTLLYNFTDGISMSINIKDAIFVYDNGLLVRQYDSGLPAMDALLDIAKQF